MKFPTGAKLGKKGKRVVEQSHHEDNSWNFENPLNVFPLKNWSKNMCCRHNYIMIYRWALNQLILL